ncbi:MAG: hypothetical protein RIR00_1943 [Pseudomonadota bacterium]|jgi:squalene-associated FAD-dependent desaturase
MKVAVIGAGWAGLAAAVSLSAAGLRPTLIEAGRRPGGRARRADLPGENLDNGQHLLLGAYRETLALMRQVGADPEQLLQRLPLHLADQRGFRLQLPDWPPPLHLAWGLLRARGLSLADKFAAARWMQQLRGTGFRLIEDCSVADWLSAARQPAALRQQLWEPLCLAALNTPAERASAQVFANVLRDSLGSPEAGATDLLIPRCDLSRLLPEPASTWLAARSVELRFGQRVRQLHAGGSGWQVEGETFDQVILATAPQHAARLLPAPLPALAELLASGFEAIATLYYDAPAEFTPPAPLYALNGGLGQWVIAHPPLQGRRRIAAILSGNGPWQDLEATALAARIAAELGLPAGSPWRLLQEKRATFSCRPRQARPSPATPWPGLHLAGDYCHTPYPATLEAAVRSGREAAGRVLQNLAAAS